MVDSRNGKKPLKFTQADKSGFKLRSRRLT